MMRPLPIAAALTFIIAASVALAQDVPTASGAIPGAAAPATSQAASNAPDSATSQTPTSAPAPGTPAPAAPVAAPAVAALPAPATREVLAGVAARGKGLAYTCRGCHGVTGYKNAYPSYHVPKLGGQSQTYLHNALNEYRDNKRKHPTMQAQAQSFSEQDIADIAAYLAGLK